ncbi:DUF1203 domain-containing protein [Phenylobacterium sp. J426]|uniref:DUF1203 domain-containing protein n=1 Tax=Phenylobacterium sp. J426 TaxID=2898439 RepID=UPI002151AD13|nr:DUF1203 domain-containing protein [Phenylobacterium sp. J426]MCR5876020.1 DUF1203 domain-containing protein [Phenylobacterium sp. J426]
MSYVVTGLSEAEFQPLFGLSDAALAERGVQRMTVTAPQGFPCRISLQDRPVGETVLLLNYEHQPADTPFRSRHAVFVGEQAGPTARYVDELPPVLAVRPFTSLRAFDTDGMMTDGQLVPRADLADAIARMLAAPGTAYLHAHYPGRGCYAARIDRA